jgi:hypothetical protein
MRVGHPIDAVAFAQRSNCPDSIAYVVALSRPNHRFEAGWSHHRKEDRWA